MTQIITSIYEIRNTINRIKKKSVQIGFVPTMGALHKGHLSLVQEAKKENTLVVVSIFVNPLQFGQNEDFEHYPNTFDEDWEILSNEGVDIIFSPRASEMYPPGFSTSISFGSLEEKLCGKSRQGHFRGVAVVLLKLFQLIKPNIAYFGQKDFQQTVIIKRIVSDLNIELIIKVLPIIRDKYGLALSSRNIYLNEKEKHDARCLYKALQKARSMFIAGTINSQQIIHEMEKIINQHSSVTIDYISIVNQDTLEAVTEVSKNNVVALAVKIGKARLIDNIILSLLIAITMIFIVTNYTIH